MTITISIPTAAFVILAFAVIQFLGVTWIKAKVENSIKSKYDKLLEEYKLELRSVENSIKSDYDKLLEEYRFGLRAREKAEKICEYAALYIKNEPTDFPRMNQLSFELSLCLPVDIYKSLGKALQRTEGEKNLLEVLLDVREFILNDPVDNDFAEKIISHGVGFGTQTPE